MWDEKLAVPITGSLSDTRHEVSQICKTSECWGQPVELQVFPGRRRNDVG